MFWVYYPDLRPMMAKAEVYNPKNMGQSRMTWEELFESRMFSSYVIKSTMDNAANKTIKQYISSLIQEEIYFLCQHFEKIKCMVLKEDFLQHLWQFKLFDQNNLQVTECESLEIIDVGQRNTDAAQ